jgi:hypothetical protein
MKIAIKVLSQSDLSFFAAHHDSSKQRAIELNSEVFIERFYPGLRDASAQVIFPLVLLGPGGKMAHRLTRMAMRSFRAKNWLITGEPIYDPDEEPDRYRKLAQKDFAIMFFEGTGRPQAVTLILVSAEVYAASWLDGAPHVFVAVKTTCLHSERPIHMSIAELRFAAQAKSYRIARL